MRTFVHISKTKRTRQLKILLTYLRTELSPSWEAANCAAIQKIPSKFKEPEGSSPCSQDPPPVPILSQSNPVPTIPSYLSKIHFNIVHLPTPWSSQWSLSFWLSHQYPICIPPLPHSCYMPCPSHPPWLDHSNYVWRGVQVMTLIIMQFPPLKILLTLFNLEFQQPRSCRI
jgi:hypothetical protein